MKKILLGCYDAPGWGGAATVLYLLFEKMQRDGLDVAYVNLVNAKDEVFLRYMFGESFGNPRSLENVHTCSLEDPLWRRQPALADLTDTVAPDLLLGFGFIAARLLKLAAQRSPVVFMTAGSRQLQQLIEAGAIKDFMGFKRNVERGVVFPTQEWQECQAMGACDLFIVHSPLVRFALEYFFPGYAGKIYSNTVSVADIIYPEANEFASLKLPFTQRDIDVIFVASSWDRPEKNYSLARKIVSRCRGMNIHIVGESSRPCPGAQHHGLITQREILYGLLGRTKTMVCPSRIDAAPGVLFEASAMDCNLVTSPNAGNWQLCNDQLVAEHCSVESFEAKINRSLSGQHKDNRERFRGGYADLIDTLSIF